MRWCGSGAASGVALLVGTWETAVDEVVAADEVVAVDEVAADVRLEDVAVEGVVVNDVAAAEVVIAAFGVLVIVEGMMMED